MIPLSLKEIWKPSPEMDSPLRVKEVHNSDILIYCQLIHHCKTNTQGFILIPSISPQKSLPTIFDLNLSLVLLLANLSKQRDEALVAHYQLPCFLGIW